MRNEVVIKVESVSKKYCKSLKNSMFYGINDIVRNTFGLSSHSNELRKGEFWALDDVSFEVKRGELVGLIGPNGSGKTTLLKMLNGIFWPDKGKISVNGRVGALIAVGAGFHPMLSGRENIYINGAILGMNKREIDEKLDAIIEFADIGDFLDSPVKHYSSGMFVRLGFAIAVHCEPDILLVDEILAVGDRNFQIKCFRKMHEIKEKGNVAIILVSHNEYTMKTWTQKCIVLNNGKEVYAGKSEDAVQFYVNNDVKQNQINQDSFKICDGNIIKKVHFKNTSEKNIYVVQTGEKVTIDFHYKTERKIISPIFAINFNNSNGFFAGIWSSYENIKLPDIYKDGRIRVIIDPFDLPADLYNCAVVLCEKEDTNVLQWTDLPRGLKVVRSKNARGFVKLRQSWEWVET